MSTYSSLGNGYLNNRKAYMDELFLGHVGTGSYSLVPEDASLLYFPYDRYGLGDLVN